MNTTLTSKDLLNLQTRLTENASKFQSNQCIITIDLLNEITNLTKLFVTHSLINYKDERYLKNSPASIYLWISTRKQARDTQIDFPMKTNGKILLYDLRICYYITHPIRREKYKL